jgi:hypothetical protein
LRARLQRFLWFRGSVGALLAKRKTIPVPDDLDERSDRVGLITTD